MGSSACPLRYDRAIFWHLLIGLCAAAQTLVVEVVADPPAAMTVEVEWLGETRSAPLEDPDGDGVMSARFEGERLRFAHVRLLESGDEVHRGIEPVTDAAMRLSYVIDDGQARRVALAASPRARETRDGLRLAAVVGWTALLFLYVAWLVGRRR